MIFECYGTHLIDSPPIVRRIPIPKLQPRRHSLGIVIVGVWLPTAGKSTTSDPASKPWSRRSSLDAARTAIPIRKTGLEMASTSPRGHGAKPWSPPRRSLKSQKQVPRYARDDTLYIGVRAVDLGGAARLPRSLHCATRRTTNRA
jgi:hypothetical protein